MLGNEASLEQVCDKGQLCVVVATVDIDDELCGKGALLAMATRIGRYGGREHVAVGELRGELDRSMVVGGS
jgi:hypothetical protein